MWTKVHYEQSPTKPVGVECIQKSKGQNNVKEKCENHAEQAPLNSVKEELQTYIFLPDCF